MPDQIDRANDLAEQQRTLALAKILQNPTACSLTHCETCGEPIPEKRREMVHGCTRCVDCQTIFEHQQKGYRK